MYMIEINYNGTDAAYCEVFGEGVYMKYMTAKQKPRVPAKS